MMADCKLSELSFLEVSLQYVRGPLTRLVSDTTDPVFKALLLSYHSVLDEGVNHPNHLLTI
jgi:hypothetical protein